ncbi:hypothetical protein PCANB_001975 [Pneumocystis canis]|nr:hypothetical protein PCANB_001975 [Pneumocystis canis]
MGKSRAKQRKQGDKWYYLAKEQGYRSRSSFKLIQLNKKYHFLEKTKILIDLCAAPGGWLQVASKFCMPGSLICGVDLVSIKPIPNVITFVEDITTDKCCEKLQHYLKTWKADTILHDGAPNVGVTWLHDAYSQIELVLMSLKIVTKFLIFNGTFVTKVFRSKDYNNLLWVLNQLFRKVEATKPLASRDVSAEIFKKKRQRDGYEDGNYTQHKVVTAEEFLKSNNPIEILSIASAINFDDRDSEIHKKIKNLEFTTKEIIICCEDLRVLGKKDFRNLLKWRNLVREKLNLVEKKETDILEKIEIKPLEEEEEIEQEMKKLYNQKIMKKKKEKRRILELKRKSIQRMHLGVVQDMNVGLEQVDTVGEESLFGISSLKELDKLGIENEKTDLVSNDDINTTESETVKFESTEDELDELNELEEELNEMYEYYRSKKENNKIESKIDTDFSDIDETQLNNIKEVDSGLKEESNLSFEDINEELGGDSSMEDSSMEDITEDSEATSPEKEDKLSRKAALFFDRDIFKIHNNNNIKDQNINIEGMKHYSSKNIKNPAKLSPETQNNSTCNNNLKILSKISGDKINLTQENKNTLKSEINILSPEAMTLAQSIASQKKLKRDIIDDAYNKWAFQDNDNLPRWFLDDEKKHNKRNIPISKEAVMAIREKIKAINARPIKKVLEAKARKRMKTMKRLKWAQEKADSIMQTNDITEKKKAENIKKILNKAIKSKHRNRVKVVVTKGANKGIKGRPKGIKERYKLVDPRMKKELRARKRIAKRRK